MGDPTGAFSNDECGSHASDSFTSSVPVDEGIPFLYHLDEAVHKGDGGDSASSYQPKQGSYRSEDGSYRSADGSQRSGSGSHRSAISDFDQSDDGSQRSGSDSSSGSSGSSTRSDSRTRSGFSHKSGNSPRPRRSSQSGSQGSGPRQCDSSFSASGSDRSGVFSQEDGGTGSHQHGSHFTKLNPEKSNHIDEAIQALSTNSLTGYLAQMLDDESAKLFRDDDNSSFQTNSIATVYHQQNVSVDINFAAFAMKQPVAVTRTISLPPSSKLSCKTADASVKRNVNDINDASGSALRNESAHSNEEDCASKCSRNETREMDESSEGSISKEEDLTYPVIGMESLSCIVIDDFGVSRGVLGDETEVESSAGWTDVYDNTSTGCGHDSDRLLQDDVGDNDESIPHADSDGVHSGSQYSRSEHSGPQHSGSQYSGPQHSGSQHVEFHRNDDSGSELLVCEDKQDCLLDRFSESDYQRSDLDASTLSASRESRGVGQVMGTSFNSETTESENDSGVAKPPTDSLFIFTDEHRALQETDLLKNFSFYEETTTTTLSTTQITHSAHFLMGKHVNMIPVSGDPKGDIEKSARDVELTLESEIDEVSSEIFMLDDVISNNVESAARLLDASNDNVHSFINAEGIANVDGDHDTGRLLHSVKNILDCQSTNILIAEDTISRCKGLEEPPQVELADEARDSASISNARNETVNNGEEYSDEYVEQTAPPILDDTANNDDEYDLENLRRAKDVVAQSFDTQFCVNDAISDISERSLVTNTSSPNGTCFQETIESQSENGRPSLKGENCVASGNIARAQDVVLADAGCHNKIMMINMSDDDDTSGAGNILSVENRSENSTEDGRYSDQVDFETTKGTVKGVQDGYLDPARFQSTDVASAAKRMHAEIDGSENGRQDSATALRKPIVISYSLGGSIPLAESSFEDFTSNARERNDGSHEIGEHSDKLLESIFRALKENRTEKFEFATGASVESRQTGEQPVEFLESDYLPLIEIDDVSLQSALESSANSSIEKIKTDWRETTDKSSGKRERDSLYMPTPDEEYSPTAPSDLLVVQNQAADNLTTGGLYDSNDSAWARRVYCEEMILQENTPKVVLEESSMNTASSRQTAEASHDLLESQSPSSTRTTKLSTYLADTEVYDLQRRESKSLVRSMTGRGLDEFVNSVSENTVDWQGAVDRPDGEGRIDSLSVATQEVESSPTNASGSTIKQTSVHALIEELDESNSKAWSSEYSEETISECDSLEERFELSTRSPSESLLRLRETDEQSCGLLESDDSSLLTNNFEDIQSMQSKLSLASTTEERHDDSINSSSRVMTDQKTADGSVSLAIPTYDVASLPTKESDLTMNRIHSMHNLAEKGIDESNNSVWLREYGEESISECDWLEAGIDLSPRSISESTGRSRETDEQSDVVLKSDDSSSSKSYVENLQRKQSTFSLTSKVVSSKVESSHDMTEQQEITESDSPFWDEYYSPTSASALSLQASKPAERGLCDLKNQTSSRADNEKLITKGNVEQSLPSLTRSGNCAVVSEIACATGRENHPSQESNKDIETGPCCESASDGECEESSTSDIASIENSSRSERDRDQVTSSESYRKESENSRSQRQEQFTGKCLDLPLTDHKSVKSSDSKQKSVAVRIATIPTKPTRLSWETSGDVDIESGIGATPFLLPAKDTREQAPTEVKIRRPTWRYLAMGLVCLSSIVLAIVIPVTVMNGEENRDNANASPIAPSIPLLPPSAAPRAAIAAPALAPNALLSPWLLRATLNGSTNSAFGTAVAINDGLLLVGEPLVGKVKFFHAASDGSKWIEGGETTSEQHGGHFGSSIDVVRQRMVVGAPFVLERGTNKAAGSALFYVYNPLLNSWQQVGNTLRGDGKNATTTGEEFGSAVAASNIFRVVVGAPKNSQHEKEAGRVYTFDYGHSEGSWASGVTFPFLGESAGDKFGFSVAMSRDGSRFVGGAPGGGKGYASMYYLSGTNWQLVFLLRGKEDSEAFGSSISFLSEAGEIVAIGGPGFGHGAGRIVVYQQQPSSGEYYQLGPDIVGEPGDSYGRAGSLSGGIGTDGPIVVVNAKNGIVNCFIYDPDLNSWKQYGRVPIVESNQTTVGFSTNGATDILVVGYEGLGQTLIYEREGSASKSPTQTPIVPSYPSAAPLRGFVNSPTSSTASSISTRSPSIRATLMPTITNQSLSNATLGPPVPSIQHQKAWVESGGPFKIGQSGTDFVSAVSLSDSCMAAGAPASLGVGIVVTFEKVNGTWGTSPSQQIIGKQEGGGFGSALDMLDDALVVGASASYSDNATTSTGAAFYYIRNQEEWIQLGSTLRGDLGLYGKDEGFGASIAASSNLRVAVGAPRSSVELLSHRGRVYVYEFDSVFLDWKLIEDVTGKSAGESFGFAVDIATSGNFMIVGAPGSGHGYASIYQYNVNSWFSITTISGDASDEAMGSSVTVLSYDGFIVAAGGPGYENGRGRVVVYERNVSIGKFSQVGPAIVGDIGERIGDTNKLSGESGSSIVVVVGTATGMVKRFELDRSTLTWIQSVATIDTTNKTYASLLAVALSPDSNSFVAGCDNKSTIYELH